MGSRGNVPLGIMQGTSIRAPNGTWLATEFLVCPRHDEFDSISYEHETRQ